jgi:hypothetical protein
VWRREDGEREKVHYFSKHLEVYVRIVWSEEREEINVGERRRGEEKG